MRAPLKMRYLETLDKANEVCLRRANKLPHCCGVEASAERCNTFMQSGDDCVWRVLHYAEVEARVEHVEGLGCLSIGHGLRKQHIKHCLKLASQQLEAAMAKWLQEGQRHACYRPSAPAASGQLHYMKGIIILASL